MSSGPLPGLPSPTSLVEGPHSVLASGGGSGWGAGRGWSLLLPGAPGVLSPKGPRGQACQLLLIQKGSDSGGPCSHQELLLQLCGTGRLVLQGLPAEGAPGRAQEVQRDLLGRAHGADGLHSPQGPHVHLGVEVNSEKRVPEKALGSLWKQQGESGVWRMGFRAVFIHHGRSLIWRKHRCLGASLLAQQ